MSSVGLVHLVYIALRDLPVCIQFIYTAYGSCTVYQFRDPYRSMQHVYKITVCYRLLSTTRCSAVSGIGLVHLVYNALRDLPVCIQFLYPAYGSCMPYKFREPHRSLQRVYKIAVCFRQLATTCCIGMSSVELVHLVYNSLWDLPVCIQLIYRAYGSYTPYKFTELHRSLQRVYEIAVCFRFLATTWCIAVSGVELIHLVYNSLWDLPVCIQVIYTAYGSCTVYQFREPYGSIQHVYEIAVCCRLLATTWCIAVSGVGLVHIVYNAQRDLPVCIQFIYMAYGCCTVYKFTEPHRSLQRVYKIAVCFRFLTTTWCIAVSGVELVHLVYNSL